MRRHTRNRDIDEGGARVQASAEQTVEVPLLSGVLTNPLNVLGLFAKNLENALGWDFARCVPRILPLRKLLVCHVPEVKLVEFPVELRNALQDVDLRLR